MELSFRWYGPKDSVKLTDIRQSDANFIVTSLHQIPTGVKWSNDDIKRRNKFINSQNSINSRNLKWNVVESIPVHNNIKLRNGNYRKLINNFKDTIANIAKNDIKTICYNFMPVIDWTRTELDFKLPSDALALRFNYLHIIVFEKYILKLKDLESRYNSKLIKLASRIYKVMKSKDIRNLKFAIMGGLPAAEKRYSISEFKKMLYLYKDINQQSLRSNLKEFLNEIIPVAEDCNVKMALHPDDPPISLFGLPRIVKGLNDYEFIFNSYNSNYSGMTFCTGSLASNYKNNVYEIFKKFKKKVFFIHLRNIKIESDKKSFYESNHLEGNVNFVKIIKMITEEEKRRKKFNKNFNIPMRPDHGHCLLDDKNKTLNPGYSVIGRMKGLAEIRGIIQAIK